MKKIALLLMILILSISSVFASEITNIDPNDKFLQEILISDIPVTYGDEAFRERIFERTKGERDPIGLVLTGGSARACAHVGVLKYLEQNGIVPDFIVANSMGSIIGMLYAAGVSPLQIEEILLAGDLSSLFSLTLPIGGGIIVPTGFRTLIESIVGTDMKIEDTEIPIMVVCADLVTKREIRIAEGDFTDILIASFALPFYFDPYEYKGHLLIDGGVISLAPIDVAYEYTDTVVLSTTFYDAEDIQLRNPVTVINTAYDVSKRQKVAEDMRKHDDFIWIRCNVENYSFMAFDKAIEMSKIGYESARAVEDELNELYKAGTITQGMARKRVNTNVIINKAAKDLSYFGRVEAADQTLLLGLSVSPVGFMNTPYYLKNSSSAGADLQFLNKGFEASVSLGYGYDTYNLHSPNGFLALEGDAAYYFLDNFRITGEFHVDAFAKGSHGRPALFFRQGFDYIPFFSQDLYEIAVHQSLEYYKNYALKERSAALVVSVSADAMVKVGEPTLSGKLGYIFSGKSISGENPGNFVDAEIGVSVPFMKHLFFETGIFSRIRVDSNLSEDNRVPLFMSDGYASTTVKLGSEALYSEAKYHNTIFSVFAGYDFDKDPTFGEIIIMEDMKSGIYCDLLLSDTKLGVSTGLDITSNLSIIGLVKIPFSLRLGYEYIPGGESAFVSSLVLSAVY